MLHSIRRWINAVRLYIALWRVIWAAEAWVRSLEKLQSFKTEEDDPEIAKKPVKSVTLKLNRDGTMTMKSTGGVDLRKFMPKIAEEPKKGDDDVDG